MIALYPKTTPEIFHRGKAGNVYRLDGFDKCVRLYEKIKDDLGYEVITVSSSGNESLAKQLIRLAHPQKIISAYKTGKPSELANASGVLWQPKLYNFVLESAIASKEGVDQATSDQRSLVITGGGHHAQSDHPFGFCTINTMSIAALYAQKKNGLRAAIVDLDVHYSNGCLEILKGNPDIFVASLWNQKLDKWRFTKSKDNLWDKHVQSRSDYFRALKTLSQKLHRWQPELIIYHLGLDVLKTDRMGGVGLSPSDLLRREKLVSQMFKKAKVPYVIFLGGAYVDYSKGEKFAQKQKASLTNLQYRALSYYN